MTDLVELVAQSNRDIQFPLTANAPSEVDYLQAKAAIAIVLWEAAEVGAPTPYSDGWWAEIYMQGWKAKEAAILALADKGEE